MAKSVLSGNQRMRLAVMAREEEKHGFSFMPAIRVALLLEAGMVVQRSGPPSPENPRSEAKYTLTDLGRKEVKAYRKRQRRKEDREEAAEALACISCEAELTIPGGYAGTDLCGPCACGSAELLEERGISW